MSGLLQKHVGLNLALSKHAVSLSVGMATLVFCADLMTPLGVASGVPYSLAILLALNSSSRRYVVSFAILCSILTVLAFLFGPGRGNSELWKVLTNRSLALGMIWITMTLGVMRKTADRRRREAEEQTRLHLADLAHISRLKTAGELATTLAHELNQPLAAISFQSEIASRLVADGSTVTPQLLNALREVTDQSHRAADIIRSLRKLVGKSEPQQSLMHLNDLVHDVTRLTEAQFRNRHVDLQLRLREIPAVMGDRIQLEQVLLNLLQNSLDSILESTDDRRYVVVETEPSGAECVALSVHDTGAGLKQDESEKVFCRFYSSKSTGMGMGLAISRSIIEAHQGRLWAEPSDQDGATFRFTLPTVA